MKKLLSYLLVLLLAFELVGCGDSDPTESEATIKIGAVLIGDENEGYSAAHVKGLNAAASKYGAQVTYKKNAGDGGPIIADDEEALIEDGCTLIISNSYGHQSYTLDVASRNPDIMFVAMTGDNAANSNLDNLANAFTSIYEARYVAGIVAGAKLKELIEEDKLSEDNYVDGCPLIGYISAFPYAECISGYTAYYLGVKSIVPNVVMKVVYTNNWGSAPLEKTAAETLIADGCIIISQHADTTGAPSAIEAAHVYGKEVYCVGYNISMLDVAPTSALTSATNNWEIAYDYIIKHTLNNEKFKDWNGGYNDDAVMITDLGDACAKDTEDLVIAAEAALKDGSLHVFDCSTFTIDGKNPISILGDLDGDYEPETECVFDGYFHESEFRSAPYFAVTIDGIITE